VAEVLEAQRRYEVELTGCRPEPLGSYLKALAVLRLVAEQKDREARGCWRGEYFVLTSTLDRDALVRFFVEQWLPTPVIAPWNGGSGFYPKDNKEAPEAMLASSDARLGAFVDAIQTARSYVARQGWTERPADEAKRLLLAAMRARLPDAALAWLDAAVILADDRLLFPPLLGTGGNDGRLDFSNNFQQRVVEVMSNSDSAALLASLIGAPMTSRFKGAMGQYQPAASARSNPWDFVLLIEGALVFAGAATRRMESGSPSVMAFPFHARAAGGIGTVVETDEHESRDELWLPLWSQPTTFRELRHLFAEGRATVGSGERARQASSALDFARAVTALGVDRGIDAFSRIGFHVRNGLAYYATPLGRFSTRQVRASRLLDDVENWYERFRQKASGTGVPARVATTRRRLEHAMFEAAQRGVLAPVVLALGDAEAALAQSLAFATKSFLHPAPWLQPAWWSELGEDTVELRLASALASRPGMRRRLVPLDKSGWSFGRSDDASVSFTARPLVDNLHALLVREDIETQQGLRELPAEPREARCSLRDIADFIAGRVDDALIDRWLRGLVLLETREVRCADEGGPMPPALFAVLSLVQHRRLGGETLLRTSGVLTRACAGDAAGASAAAIRRLNASGRALPVPAILETRTRTRRIAAALAFPLTAAQRRQLECMVLAVDEDDFRLDRPQAHLPAHDQEPT
jgi:CRISPR-associated protein Csx17